MWKWLGSPRPPEGHSVYLRQPAVSDATGRLWLHKSSSWSSSGSSSGMVGRVGPTSCPLPLLGLPPLFLHPHPIFYHSQPVSYNGPYFPPCLCSYPVLSSCALPTTGCATLCGPLSPTGSQDSQPQSSQMRRRLSYWSKMLEGGGEGCEEKWVKRVRGRDLKMGGGTRMGGCCCEATSPKSPSSRSSPIMSSRGRF